MIRAKTFLVFTVLVTTQLIWVATADAGPLLDWIRGRRTARQVAPQQPCATPCGTNACATGSCTTTCMQTCQRVVVNYVPCTAYRTSWDRVPVTTYRQTTSTDPCSGCTVTCNKPCTTYTYRMKQVPYTTYRPVYRTETYQVPVTYTTPAPAQKPSCGLFSGCCNLFKSSAPTTVQSVPVQTIPMTAPMAAPSTGCNSCATPAAPMMTAPSTNFNTPTYYEGSPSSISTPPSSSLPADQVPTLANPQNMQKPVIEGTSSSSTTTWPAPNTTVTPPPYNAIPDPIPSNRWNTGNGSPSLVDPFNQSARAPSVERWNYSPVKLVSYEDPLKVPVALQTESSNTISTATQAVTPKPRVNEGWRTD